MRQRDAHHAAEGARVLSLRPVVLRARRHDGAGVAATLTGRAGSVISLPCAPVFPSFLAGWLLGFFGSTPIAGPTAALVVNRALQKRGGSGVRVAMGSAVAETFYAFLAVWGLAAM